MTNILPYLDLMLVLVNILSALWTIYQLRYVSKLTLVKIPWELNLQVFALVVITVSVIAASMIYVIGIQGPPHTR